MSWAERPGGQHRPISLVVAPPNGERDRLSGGGSPRLPTRPADTHQLCLCHHLRRASSWTSPTSILPCILLSLCLRSFFPAGLLVARAQDVAYGAWCVAEQTMCGSSYDPGPRCQKQETQLREANRCLGPCPMLSSRGPCLWATGPYLLSDQRRRQIGNKVHNKSNAQREPSYTVGGNAN